MEPVFVGLIVYYLVTRFVPVVLYLCYAKRIFGDEEGIRIALAFTIVACFTPLVGELVYLIFGFIFSIFSLFLSGDRIDKKEVL